MEICKIQQGVKRLTVAGLEFSEVDSSLICPLAVSPHTRGGVRAGNWVTLGAVSIYWFQTTRWNWNSFARKRAGNKNSEKCQRRIFMLVISRSRAWWYFQKECSCTFIFEKQIHARLVTDSKKLLHLGLKITRYQWLIRRKGHEITFPNIWHFYLISDIFYLIFLLFRRGLDFNLAKLSG